MKSATGAANRLPDKRLFQLARSPLDILIAVNGSRTGLAGMPKPQLLQWSKVVDIAIRRERAKAQARHWSYDLNRHIALKTARDSLRRELGARPPGVRL